MRKRKCLVCLEIFYYYCKLPCGTICCYECLVEYIKIQSKGLIYRSQVGLIPCVAFNCHVQIDILELYSSLHDNWQKQLKSVINDIHTHSQSITKKKSCLCTEKTRSNLCKSLNCLHKKPKIQKK